MSWEEVIGEIEKVDPASAASIRVFYERCMEFNRSPG
jgi:hypothetical protein